MYLSANLAIENFSRFSADLKQKIKEVLSNMNSLYMNVCTTCWLNVVRQMSTLMVVCKPKKRIDEVLFQQNIILIKLTHN